MKRLAAQMLPVFRSRDVHREALAALAVFQQAAAAENAGLELRAARPRLPRPRPPRPLPALRAGRGGVGPLTPWPPSPLTGEGNAECYPRLDSGSSGRSRRTMRLTLKPCLGDPLLERDELPQRGGAGYPAAISFAPGAAVGAAFRGRAQPRPSAALWVDSRARPPAQPPRAICRTTSASTTRPTASSTTSIARQLALDEGIDASRGVDRASPRAARRRWPSSWLALIDPVSRRPAGQRSHLHRPARARRASSGSPWCPVPTGASAGSSPGGRLAGHRGGRGAGPAPARALRRPRLQQPAGHPDAGRGPGMPCSTLAREQRHDRSGRTTLTGCSPTTGRRCRRSRRSTRTGSSSIWGASRRRSSRASGWAFWWRTSRPSWPAGAGALSGRRAVQGQEPHDRQHLAVIAGHGRGDPDRGRRLAASPDGGEAAPSTGRTATACSPAWRRAGRWTKSRGCAGTGPRAGSSSPWTCHSTSRTITSGLRA